MEIHIQKCQKCKSRETRNILVREKEDLVFVQCLGCDSLVAKYTLKPGGYIHIGKGYESYLRAFERSGMSLSSRDMLASFEEEERQSQESFREVLEKVREKYGK